MINRLDPRHLELLRELADRGTIAAVAAATFRTPSAVSQQVRTAERDLGVRLVEPDGRGVRLTPAGRLLAERSVDVEAALARVGAELQRLQGSPTGTVSLAILPSAAEVLVAPLLTRLVGSEIAVECVDLDVSEVEFGRRASDSDLVVGHSLAEQRPPWAGRLLVRTLAKEPLDVALPATHPLAAQKVVSASDLVGIPWIGVPAGFPFDTVRLAIENASGVPFDVVQRIRDNRVVESLVAAGMGAALLPRFTTRPREGIVTRPLTGVRSERRILAIARPDKAERIAVKVVLEALAEVGKTLA